MAGETIICVIGNLVDAPELRFTPNGAAVANFVIASTPRYFDKQANEFKDGETLFVRCNLWREAAENAAESLTKGTRVIAQGQLKARSFETREGDRRTSWELAVDEIGPSLRYATAQSQKSGKSSMGFGGGGNPATQGFASAPYPGQSQAQSDPWAPSQSAGQQPQSGGWPATDEPDF